MWPEHRIAAERSGLGYPGDLTDGEWVKVAPMIPPGKRGGRPRRITVREVVNGIFYVLWKCQWEWCRRTYRRRARCGSISIYGPATARWSAFITRSAWGCASRLAARRARHHSDHRQPGRQGGAKRGASLHSQSF